MTALAEPGAALIDLERTNRRVLAQLIEALTYEGVLPPPAGEELRIDGRDDRGEPVTYACRVRRTASFDRIKLAGDPVRIAAGTPAPAADPARFLREDRKSVV